MNHPILPTRRHRAGLSAAALIVLALPLAGCGKSLECSSEETRKLIYELAAKEFREAFDLPADWSSPDLKFALLDVITREKGKTKTVCAAKLHIAAPTDPAGKTGLVLAKPITEKDFDITYQLERTDDGRLVVRVDGL